MMEKKKQSTIRTPLARVSYANVYKAKAYKDQKPKFSCDLIFKPGADLSELNRAIHQAKVAQWGADKSRWPRKMREPIKDGSEKEGQKEYQNRKYITPSNEHRPYVVDRDLQPIPPESNEFYSGCFAYAAVRVKAYDSPMNKGVAIYLEGLVKAKDGDKFGGSSRPEDVFQPLTDEEIEETDGEGQDAWKQQEENDDDLDFADAGF